MERTIQVLKWATFCMCQEWSKMRRGQHMSQVALPFNARLWHRPRLRSANSGPAKRDVRCIVTRLQKKQTCSTHLPRLGCHRVLFESNAHLMHSTPTPPDPLVVPLRTPAASIKRSGRGAQQLKAVHRCVGKCRCLSASGRTMTSIMQSMG